MTNQFGTPTLFNLYPDIETFEDDLTLMLPSFSMTKEEQRDLFMLIASRYGDSNIRYTNNNLFKLNLFRHIKVYYPKVLAFIRDQARLRDASTEEFQIGGKSITNMGSHNTADISTDTTQGINQLDSQQISNVKRGELVVLIDRLAAYRAGEENRFLDGLNGLFIQIISPQADLLYGTPINEEEN